MLCVGVTLWEARISVFLYIPCGVLDSTLQNSLFLIIAQQENG